MSQPMNTRQFVARAVLTDIADIENWLKEFTSIKHINTNEPYYQHIDHLHLFEIDSGEYTAIVLFHRIYLQKT